MGRGLSAIAVSSPTRAAREAELRETFELMSGLEAFSGELACERITPAELSEIKALHYAMLACREQNDLSGYYSRNQAIHDKINDAAAKAGVPISPASALR